METMSNRPPEIQALMDRNERRIKLTVFWAIALCVIAIVIPGLSAFVPVLRPKSEHTNLWFQRSGSLMTVIAVFANVKAASLLELIRGGAFGESWNMHHKYIALQKVASWTSIFLVCVGTIIWGYGDLLIK